MARAYLAYGRLSEEAWQAQVVDLAALLGWAHYHTRRSDRSVAGFPDLVLIRPPRLVVAELKAEGRKPTGAQRGWLKLFQLCGVEAYVWQPSDLGRVQKVLEGRR